MMFKTSAIILSLTAALQLVMASSVTLTAPAANSVLEAGSTVEIKWKVESTTAGPIRLQYASGPSQSLTINGLIADNVEAALGKYSWTIPKDIKQKKIVIEAGPNAKDIAFAGYLNIKKSGAVTKKPTTKKHTTKKHTTKKTTHKKTTHKKTTHKKPTSTKKGTKTTTKKTAHKKTTKKTTKKHKPSAVCIGYPSSGNGTATHSKDSVRCHSLPKEKAVAAKRSVAATLKKVHKKHTKKTGNVSAASIPATTEIKHPHLIGA